jgi:hypothetical protein
VKNSLKNPVVSPIAPQSHKSTLARLLATENISVVHQQIPTACFNLKNRTLSLPLWSTVDGSLYDMLVGHEVSHALHTVADEWRAGIATVAKTTGITEKQAQSYLNITEDARIERLIKIKFPGLRRDFFAAYVVLKDRKFFGDLSKVATMCFADRINLYCKMGLHTGLVVPFSVTELPLLAEVESTLTFADVVQVAIRIIQQQQEAAQQHPEPQDEDSDEGESEPGEGSEEAEGEMEGEAAAPPEDTGTTDSKPQQQTAPQTAPIPTPVTNERMESEIAKQLNETAKDQPEVIRIRVPSAHRTAIVDYKEIHSDVAHQIASGGHTAGQTEWITKHLYTPVRVAEYKSASTAMSMAFERRKSADLYRRSSISKGGSLDTLRMNQYRWTDDIFRRTVRVSEGKNHGVVILLDWSGSMSHIMQSTIGQLLILTDFCRQSNIPFEVYAFSDSIWIHSAEGAHGMKAHTSKATAKQEEYTKEDAFIQPISLLNWLSSRMTKSEYEIGKSLLWNWKGLDSTIQGGTASYNYHLSGTPTTSAVFEMSHIMADFIQRTGVHCPHTVILTDGEPSDDIRLNPAYMSLHPVIGQTAEETEQQRWRRTYYSSCVLDDPMTGCSYDLTSKCKNETSAEQHARDQAGGARPMWEFGNIRVPESASCRFVWIACDILRRRTGSQVHWIGLVSGNKACPSGRRGMKPAIRSDWRRDGFVRGTVAGFDSAIIVASERFDSTGGYNHYSTPSRRGHPNPTPSSIRTAVNDQLDKASKVGSKIGLKKGFMAARSLDGGLRIIASSIGERLAV